MQTDVFTTATGWRISLPLRRHHDPAAFDALYSSKYIYISIKSAWNLLALGVLKDVCISILLVSTNIFVSETKIDFSMFPQRIPVNYFSPHGELLPQGDEPPVCAFSSHHIEIFNWFFFWFFLIGWGKPKNSTWKVDIRIFLIWAALHYSAHICNVK